jgi:hypothetical protein
MRRLVAGRMPSLTLGDLDDAVRALGRDERVPMNLAGSAIEDILF